MLTHPNTNRPYNPTLDYFLGGIEIYDQEETLGEQLWKLNPNNEQRNTIIKEHIIPHLQNLSYRHKFILTEKLEQALNDTNHDFENYFENNPNENYQIAWEAHEINTPRTFFEDIFHIIQDRWKHELYKAAKEDQSTW
ncbi:hypothetical protein FJD38_09715 [Pseudomonas saxonica]|uniref:Uncharacterized protein n=1 Tax=Pseudomonas saxonica TaxID=2600598 RepID=A0A5C5PZ30_9PSED|nr:hypothetical protein [Pseudomonas saxonica]TWR89801.1 hypothetical protein FJD38_09715 [Pseudomonas saxonica]TWR94244.1 hypothetical protein FJD37_11155 [Pseudomonas saxonica]